MYRCLNCGFVNEKTTERGYCLRCGDCVVKVEEPAKDKDVIQKEKVSDAKEVETVVSADINGELVNVKEGTVTEPENILDLNKDGKVDDKDSKIAGKVLANARHRKKKHNR